MKAIRLHARGGPESLVYEDAPQPEPHDGEVLVRVHATAVTPTEFAWAPTWATRTGEPRPLPFVLGHEFSGEVRAVAARVTSVRAGDSVYGLNDWFSDGAEADYCVARAADIASKPKSIDHVEAAVVPISALTAWQGLFDRAGLCPGQQVLIHGAAGGVGVFAVQLARWCGAHVIATASAHNLDFVRALGADEVVDYRVTRFEDVARGVDVVFDTVGGETLNRSQDVLRPGGKLITIAASSETAQDHAGKDAFFIVQANRLQLGEITRLIDSGYVRPHVDAVFPLAEARRAFEHKPRRGKVVLRVVD